MKLSLAAEAVFQPLSDAVRRDAGGSYFAYLQAREGRPDLRTRTMSKREPFFVTLASDPVVSKRPLDRERFFRNHQGDTPEPGLDRTLLWLIAVAKANRTEAYGMEEHIRVNGIRDGDHADTQGYIDMQEVYHTRILLDVLRCFDLNVTIGTPALLSRVAVQAMIRLPQRFALPLILCAEFVASVVFRLLLDVGRELLVDEPEVWKRVSTLLEQIMIDEVGHVSYCRARIGGFGLWVARLLLPSIKESLMTDQKEFAQLVGRERFERAFAEFSVAQLSADCKDAPFWLQSSHDGALITDGASGSTAG